MSGHGRRTFKVIAVAVALVALFAATALAVTPQAGTYKGKTSQKKYKKRSVELTVDSAGKVQSLDINWRAKCRKPHTYWFGGTDFKASALTQDDSGFKGSGPYDSTTHNGKFRGHVTVSLKGKFPTDTKATGRFGAKVKVFRTSDGKQVDSCKMKTGWSAKRTG